MSKTCKKRFAYPSKEEALINFIKRTERRIGILDSQLMACKISLNLAKESIKYFDFKWMDKINKDGELSAMQIVNLSPLPEFSFEMQNENSLNKSESSGIIAQYLSIFRGTSQLQYQEFINANHEFLQSLRANYHLEKE